MKRSEKVKVWSCKLCHADCWESTSLPPFDVRSSLVATGLTWNVRSGGSTRFHAGGERNLFLLLLLLLLYCQNSSSPPPSVLSKSEASVQITAATAAARVAAGVGTVRIPERHVCRILGHARKSWLKSIYFTAPEKGSGNPTGFL